MHNRIRIVWVMSLLALLMAGCAASTAGETEALLAQEYRTMNNEELLRYYFQLNDQIAGVERQSRGAGVGVGTGIGIGSDVGVGVGVSRGITRGTIAEDLRERRNDVRVELERRGIRP